MTRSIRFPIILLLFFFGFLVFFLWGSQQMPVTDPVESNYALTAKEMVLSGDWISPQIYGQYWYDKPAFVYWLLSASYTVFGFTNFASRLPAALCGALAVTAMAWYVRRITGEKSKAVWSAVFLGTSLEFWIVSHAVITDSLLFLFTLPTLFSAYIGISEKSWKHMTIAYGAAALACLAKGPVGLVLPGAILFLWCVTLRSARNFLRLFAPQGILLFLVIALPWYYTMYSIHGEDFLSQFFGLHNVTRALASEHPDDNHFYYYLVLLPVALLPWTGLSFYGMISKWKAQTPLYRFLMIWCWGTILFYTLVATKYVTYTYIAVAPALLLAVLALDDFLQEDHKAAHLSFIIPYALTLIALGAGTFYIPGNFMSFYVIAMYCLILLFTQWRKKQFANMLLLTTASMAVALACLVFGGLTNYIASRSSVDMAEYFHSLPGKHYFYKNYSTSFDYYTGETAVRIHDEAAVEDRDPRWEEKYTMPTIHTRDFLADAGGGPAYLFVPRNARKAFEKWSLRQHFEEDKAFPSGTVYRMEQP